MKLLLNALTKFICGLMLVGILLFLPAGTLCYTYGWLLIGSLFIPMLIAGFVMLFKSPEFLAKRLDVKEKQRAQKGVVALSGLMFIAGFVVAGLDYHFGWSEMPVAVTVASSVLFLVAYAPYAEVMWENAYLSRTVKVEEGQTVVDTGLYGIVRHPMYMATILLGFDDSCSAWFLVRADRLCILPGDHHRPSERRRRPADPGASRLCRV